MSLYDGLGLDAKEGGKKEKKPDIVGWGSSLKLLPSQKELQSKKASLLNLKKRTVASVAPVVDLRGRSGKNDEVRFNMQTGRMERITNSPIPTNTFIGIDGPSSFLGVNDEYDPLRPNDYENYSKKLRDRRNKDKDDERKKELQERERRRRERHREQGIEERNSDSDGESGKHRKEEDNKRTARQGGAAIAPPPCLIEDDGPPEQQPIPGMEEYAAPMGMNLKGSVASKIMAKMGYKSGAGLGRKEQGMSMALMVEKTGKRSGKVIHERDLPKEPLAQAPQHSAQTTANLLKNPSKVVLLRNMVGPGEVDDELEGETMEECQKYGKVTKCLIFEIPNVQEEEAVRIFLEFEKIDAAIKAIIDLNGRFFGGKMVQACFYNLDKFRRLDLADAVD